MPSRRIRVLIVDDSAVVRRVVQDTLAKEKDIEVVGTAVDPYFARDKILETNPDVITLDLEMPRMDGLTFLRIIMKQRPLPVVIMSSLTQSGSHHALEALRLGAVEVLGKPNGSYSIGDLGPQLIQKIRAAYASRPRPADEVQDTPDPEPPTAASPANSSEHRAAPPPPQAAAPASVAPTRSAPSGFTGYPPTPLARPPLTSLPDMRRHHPKRLILLGASTGGTEALREMLVKLPADVPPIAIVQHIPPTFSRAFAERLNAVCQFEVREARDGDVLTPGLALVAPGNYHMTLRWTGQHYRARIVTGPMVWHQRPAVDVTFKSIAETVGPYAIGGILTGMGKDGAEGLLQIRKNGGRTFSQSEASCVVYGMPRAAWELGASEHQVSLATCSQHLMGLIDAPVKRPAPATI